MRQMCNKEWLRKNKLTDKMPKTAPSYCTIVPAHRRGRRAHERSNINRPLLFASNSTHRQSAGLTPSVLAPIRAAHAHDPPLRQAPWVAGTAGRHLDTNSSSGHSLRGLDHVHDGISLRISQVERGTQATGEKILKRADMRIGNIRHMDIIADAGAIRCFIVVAIDGHCRPVTRCGKHTRDQMRLRIVCLSGVAVGVGAGSIEITQRDPS